MKNATGVLRCSALTEKDIPMFVKLLGFVILATGGLIALGILFTLVVGIVGLLVFLLKLAVPLVLIYIGYRLLTRHQRTAY